MGNYCCTNPGELKLEDIEDIKRDPIKINETLQNDSINMKTLSDQYSPRRKDTLIHQLSKRYLIARYFSATKLLNTPQHICNILFSPLPISPEIQMIDKRLPPLSFPLSDSCLIFPPVEFLTGEFYQGQWNVEKQKPEGVGSMIHRDQSKYFGSFFDGKKVGQGRLIKMDGEFYDGCFKNDIYDGEGTLTKSNGVVYKGLFKKGKESGEGVIYYEGEVIYKGWFKDGLKHGNGVLKIGEGSFYTGDFANGNMEGTGKYVWSDGKVYEGGWKGNKLHGEGKYLWPDGREYFGCYSDGNRDGYGVFKWPDGREYRGEWLNGNMHGIGTYTCITNTGVAHTIKAQWDQGKKKKILNS